MSRGGGWREPCVSRDRDIYRSWLHRLVRSNFYFILSVVWWADCSCGYIRANRETERKVEVGWGIFCFVGVGSWSWPGLRAFMGMLRGQNEVSTTGENTGRDGLPSVAGLSSALNDAASACAFLLQADRKNLTPKMSQTGGWRGVCVSTIRDSYPAWLHRFVRLLRISY